MGFQETGSPGAGVLLTAKRRGASSGAFITLGVQALARVPANAPEPDIVDPEPDIVDPEADVVEPDGDVVEPDGDVVEPDGGVVEPDGDDDTSVECRGDTDELAGGDEEDEEELVPDEDDESDGPAKATP